jgi:hypothetical protein
MTADLGHRRLLFRLLPQHLGGVGHRHLPQKIAEYRQSHREPRWKKSVSSKDIVLSTATTYSIKETTGFLQHPSPLRQLDLPLFQRLIALIQ